MKFEKSLSFDQHLKQEVDQNRVSFIQNRLSGLLGEKEVVNGRNYTFDANGTLFTARSLEYIESEIYRTEYVPVEARQHFPVMTEGNDAILEMSYEVWDETSGATIVNNYNTTTVPIISQASKKVTNPVRDIAIGYAYSVKELAQASYTNIPLTTERARIARDGIEYRLDDIAWFGDEVSGIDGLLNNIEIPRGDVANDGTGSTTEWVNKTPLQIERDVREAWQEAVDVTNGIHKPDTLILPTLQRLQLLQPISPDNNTTIEERIKLSCPGLVNIEGVPRLKGQGTAGKDLFILYRKDKRLLSLMIPMEINMEAPEKRDFMWQVLMRMSTAGVVVRYPLSLNIKEGI